ncbi:MAG: hypothetical protein OEM43_10390, partial [Gammaproteobacteria bacterium]|nr:hypothetical protein [Gammaproteobacteria bacterium]
ASRNTFPVTIYLRKKNSNNSSGFIQANHLQFLQVRYLTLNSFFAQTRCIINVSSVLLLSPQTWRHDV